MGRWRCSECGCSREVAERKRKRLGLPVLTTWAKVCSPSCARARVASFPPKERSSHREAIARAYDEVAKRKP